MYGYRTGLLLAVLGAAKGGGGRRRRWSNLRLELEPARDVLP